MEITIRRFEFDKDLEVMTAIDTKGCEEYWTQDEFNTKLKQKSVNCLVAEKNGVIIGFVIYEMFLHRFSILRISVSPYHRRQGIGSTLLEEVKSKLTNKRTLISAEVRETNLPVQLFLKSQRYKAVEMLTNYYPETKEDAFVFHYRLEKDVSS